jgi:hypothetical protein
MKTTTNNKKTTPITNPNDLTFTKDGRVMKNGKHYPHRECSCENCQIMDAEINAKVSYY